MKGAAQFGAEQVNGNGKDDHDEDTNAEEDG